MIVKTIMPSVNHVVYNKNNLISWKSDYSSIEQKIKEISSLIENQNAYLKIYQQNVSSVDAAIATVRNQINNININDNTYNYRRQSLPRDRRIATYQDNEIKVATIASFRSEFERLNGERNRLLNQMKHFEDKINKAQTKLSDLLVSYSGLEKHIPAAEIFLNTLQNKPEQLVNDLVNNLLKAFTDFEDKYFKELSSRVRISLMVVRYKLHEIFEHPLEDYDLNNFNEINQRNYLLLSSYIWEMYQNFTYESKEGEFTKILCLLVENTHMEQNGDLPDNLQTGYSGIAWLEYKKKKFLDSFTSQEKDFSKLEETFYNMELEVNTKRGYFYSTDLRSHIMHAIHLIDAEVRMKKKQNASINYHFYARTVRILNETFNNPTDQLAAKRLGEIAESVSESSVGKPGIGTLVLSGLAVVFGMLLIGLSLIGLGATLGSSSVLSVWSIALGLSLIQTQIAFVSASFLMACSGIGLAFYNWPKLNIQSQCSEVAQELMSIKERIEHYNEPFDLAEKDNQIPIEYYFQQKDYRSAYRLIEQFSDSQLILKFLLEIPEEVRNTVIQKNSPIADILAKFYIENKQYSLAKEIYEDIEKISPAAAFELEIKEKNYNKAYEIFNQGNSNCKFSLSKRKQLAQAFFSAGETEFQTGNTYKIKENWELAEQCYLRGLEQKKIAYQLNQTEDYLENIYTSKRLYSSLLIEADLDLYQPEDSNIASIQKAINLLRECQSENKTEKKQQQKALAAALMRRVDTLCEKIAVTLDIEHDSQALNEHKRLHQQEISALIKTLKNIINLLEGTKNSDLRVKLGKAHFLLADVQTYFSINAPDIKKHYRMAMNVVPENPFYQLRAAELFEDKDSAIRDSGIIKLKDMGYKVMDYVHWFDERWAKRDKIIFDIKDIHQPPEKEPIDTSKSCSPLFLLS